MIEDLTGEYLGLIELLGGVIGAGVGILLAFV